MLDRLMGICLTVLAAAVAIYVAVKLIESVAAALIAFVAVTGGLVIVVGVANALWHRHRMNRW
jgi:hypothetical protein